jgi:hypothetical protein
MSIIGLLVLVVVLGLVYYLLTMLPIPAPFKTIIHVVFILILIVVLLSWSGILSGSLNGPILRR